MASEWISVKDRLPEDGAVVLVRRSTLSPEYQPAKYWEISPTGRTGFFCGVQLTEVTHWKPLAAPQEDSNG